MCRKIQAITKEKITCSFGVGEQGVGGTMGNAQGFL